MNTEENIIQNSGVLVVYSDKRLIGACNADTALYYKADLIASTDYSPFGAPIKQWYANDDTSGYRFGFQGQEKENNITGFDGGHLAFEYRIHDARINQFSMIKEYAKKQKFDIIANFGGTYESAKTDGRLEFQRMLDYIKKYNTSHKKEEDKIKAILVWNLSRFSRTGGKAIALADELREKFGVHIITVSNPMDTSNYHGIMMQDMQLVFSRWDNETRKENCLIGMKRKLINGDWIVKPPNGYDVVRRNGERKIMINPEGKLIRQAFLWKSEGMANVNIIDRLKKKGLSINRQHMTKLFANPFYAGIMVHGLLDGNIVEGKHPSLISKEIFLKVNEITQSSSGYNVRHIRESKITPMRTFLKCFKCGGSMTGYEVKKKYKNGVYKDRNTFPAYYKCSNIGCKTNISAKLIHEKFSEVLSFFTLREELIPLVIHQIEKTHHESTKNIDVDYAILKSELKELEKDIDTMHHKFYIKEKFTQEVFDKFNGEFGIKKTELMKKIAETEKIISNPFKSYESSLKLCSKIQQLWACSKFEIKESIQKLIFPEGISYDKDNQQYRTPSINSVFSWIVSISRGSKEIKKANSYIKYELATLVHPKGFEPPTS